MPTRPNSPGTQLENQQGARWGHESGDPAWWFDEQGRMVVNTELLTAGPAPYIDADKWWHPKQTDSALAINEALQYASSRGGGVVRLGPHTYTLHSAIHIGSSNLGLEGVAGTKLFVASGASCMAVGVGPLVDNPTAGQMISDNFVRGLEIDGNGFTMSAARANDAYWTTNARCMGIQAWGTKRCVIENNYVHDTYNTAITADRSNRVLIRGNRVVNAGLCVTAAPRNGIAAWLNVPGDVTGTATRGAIIVDNHVHGFSDAGICITVNPTSQVVIGNNVVQGNHDVFLVASGYSDSYECIGVETDTTASYAEFGQISIVGNSTYQGLIGIGAWSQRSAAGGPNHYLQGVAIAGNTVKFPRSNGIYVSGRQIVVEGNVVDRYGWDPAKEAIGIKLGDVLTGSADTLQQDIVIRGNAISAYTASVNGVEASTGNKRVGIDLYSAKVETRNGITIEGNHVVGPGGRAVSTSYHAGIHARGNNNNLAIRNNEIRDHQSGIKVTDVAVNLAIEHNRVTGCNDSGILVYGSAGAPIWGPRIHGNVLSSNACWTGATLLAGIYLNQVAEAMVTDNQSLWNDSPDTPGYGIAAVNGSLNYLIGGYYAGSAAAMLGTAGFGVSRFAQGITPIGTFDF